MPSTTYAALPYPSNSGADNPPADLQALATALDTKTILTATGDTDRNNKYGTAPVNVLVVYPDGTVNIKTGAGNPGVWTTTYRPNTAWAPFPFANGYTNYDSGNPVQYRKDNQGRVFLRGQFTSVDGSAMLPSVSVPIGTLPVGFRPARFHSFATGSRWETEWTARIDIGSSGSIYLVGTSTVWATLDGVIFYTD